MMGDPTARRAITLELFAATGESIPEDDPIVTGAILFSHKFNEVARQSAEEMEKAGRLAANTVHEAVQKAALVLSDASRRCAEESTAATAKVEAAAEAAGLQIERLTADRSQLLKMIEAQILKSMRLANKGQFSSAALRYHPAWYVVVSALVGAVALAAACVVGVERGTRRAEEAGVGRSFARAVSTMDSKLKAQLMEHLRRNSR